MTCWNLRSEPVEQILHFRSPLALCEFMASTQSWSTTVWRRSIRRIRLAGQLADLFMGKRVVVCARHLCHTKSVLYAQQLNDVENIPSSSRCCPGGRRESVVKTLLVIEV